MWDNVCFYNYFHNGDIHLSRNYIKFLIKNVASKNYYIVHENSPRLLQDLPVKYLPLRWDPVNFPEMANIPNYKVLLNRGNIENIVYSHNKTLFINTWIGKNHRKYVPISVSGEGLHHSYLDTVIELNLDVTMPSIEKFIPTVDYSKYHCDDIDFYIDRSKNIKKVLICNGDVHSGQSENFNFSPIIHQLSDKFPQVHFIVTDQHVHGLPDKPNIMTSADIIKQEHGGGDLVEHSYLGKFCDIIVGRASGPFEFCKTQEIYASDTFFMC